ncbi:cytochrome P450, partial [Gigaspora rosea]
MTAVISFIALFICFYIARFYYCYFTRPNPLPGPFPLPLLGTLLQIKVDPHRWFDKHLEKSLDLWEFYLGNFRVIVIRNSDYLDKLDIFKPFDKTKFFKRYFTGPDNFNTTSSFIFNNDYHKWRRNRQFLTKVLMSKKFQNGFIDSVQGIFKRAEKQWEGKNSVTFDLSKWMSCYKTDISSITLIGRPSYSLALFDNNDNSESTKSLVEESLKLTKAVPAYMAMLTLMLYVPKYVFSIVMLGFKTMMKNNVMFNGTVDHIIKKRRKEIEDGSPVNFNFLDLLLISNSSHDSQNFEDDELPMNDSEIKAILAEVLAASIESTVSAVCLLVYNVAKNPKVLEKIRAEILNVFGLDENIIITYENLERCHYIEAVINESLRYSTPLPANLRVLEGDETIGNHYWPSGTWFWADNERIMNHPNNWNKPEYFNPDRFLSKELGGTGENIRKTMFIPFGGGVRMCPGRNLALIEIKILII